MPYISASIIMQLMTVAVPSFEALKKEGEAGRRKITQYTRYGTVGLALFQGLGMAIALESQAGLVLDPGLMFRFVTVLTLLTGTMFLMWLGEQVTERGLGNGISIIIFAGIVAGLPSALAACSNSSAPARCMPCRLCSSAWSPFWSPASWCSSKRASARYWSIMPSGRSATRSMAGRVPICP
jgi:preprotein translocase subunit SecY